MVYIYPDGTHRPHALEYQIKKNECTRRRVWRRICFLRSQSKRDQSFLLKWDFVYVNTEYLIGHGFDWPIRETTSARFFAHNYDKIRSRDRYYDFKNTLCVLKAQSITNMEGQKCKTHKMTYTRIMYTVTLECKRVYLPLCKMVDTPFHRRGYERVYLPLCKMTDLPFRF